MANEHKEDEFEVVIEGDEPEEKDTASVEDEREVESDDSDHDDEQEESSAKSEEDDGEDENEREAIRQRRRDERARKKQMVKEREETLRRELAARDAAINEMRSKLDAIEKRNAGSELAQLENAKKQAAQAYQYFKDQIRLAGEAGNYAAQADAMEKMGQAQRRFEDLGRIETAYKQRQTQPQPLDQMVKDNAQSWMERNKWYDPHARDADSRIVMSLDQQLSEEGWDARTPQYWEELESRAKKYLPHRFNSGKTATKPKSVVTGSSRESGGSSGKQTFTLSKDRVQALKDAGIWDDPKSRSEAIKRYRDYDKQQKQG